ACASSVLILILQGLPQPRPLILQGLRSPSLIPQGLRSPVHLISSERCPWRAPSSASSEPAQPLLRSQRTAAISRQDPESLLRLVAAHWTRLRHLRPDLSAASCPPAFKDRPRRPGPKDMQTQARSSLEDLPRRDCERWAAAQVAAVKRRRGGSAPVPVAACRWRQRAAASDLGVLAEAEVADGPRACRTCCRQHGTQQQHGSRQQQQQQQQKEKDKIRLCAAIFLLNNYRYVQNRLERDKMTATVQAYNYEAIKFFEEHQNKNRQSYLNRGLHAQQPLSLAGGCEYCSGGSGVRRPTNGR
uniref:Cystatin domain-containing protein n=1 Tax=Macrostomum lignano TaxID=282301 RepID=A0A1I8FAZ6_9PLAT